MKIFIQAYTLLLFFTLPPFILSAKVWTVSNDPARPAQFTTIDNAINAASPGDTLRIAGSNTAYTLSGSLLFQLTMIGEGANNPNGLSTKLSTINLGRLNSSLGSSGSKFYGIQFVSGSIIFDPSFSGGTLETQLLNNIIFERCSFNTISVAASVSKINNILIRNCYFNTNISFSGANITSFNITNCVFDPLLISGTGVPLNGNLLFRNCLFLNYTNQRFSSISGVIVENCIFYKSEPTGLTNSVFNNNITYLCNNGALPYGNNAGSGNLINVNPLFINYPPLGASFSWSHNYGLLAGSPAIGSGSNGTNIGLSGGNAPVNNIHGNSRIPVVTNITLPTSSVPVGGTLDVNIQAISRN